MRKSVMKRTTKTRMMLMRRLLMFMAWVEREEGETRRLSGFKLGVYDQKMAGGAGVNGGRLFGLVEEDVVHAV